MSDTADALKILVIEDDELDFLAVQRALAKGGVDASLTFAPTSAEGLERIKNEAYDAIFLDYLLPGKNGLNLLREIRETEIATPILVMTGKGDEKIAVEMMKAGAWDYIPKNTMTPEILSKSLNSALRVARAEKEKAQAIQALREKEHQLQAVIEYSPIILFGIDPEGSFSLLEGAGLSKIGLVGGDGVGKHYSAILGHQEIIDTMLKSARMGHEGHEILRLAKTTFETHYSPVRDENGNIIGAMGVAVDVTSHKEAERQLQRSKEIAEQSAKYREQFLANMSHEIRTPMNAIIGFARLLEKTNLSSLQKEYLEAINTSGDNLLVIINDILDLSKIEAGMLTFEQKEFDLHALLNQLAETFRIRANDKGIQLHLDLSSNLPQFVVDDPVRLNQVLFNLVGNSIKFTEKGQVQISVSTTAQKVLADKIITTLKFSIKDSGIGISKEKQLSVFESFSQASADTTRKFGGTGLGLTISKHLIELRNGHIHLESSPGKGSKFWFELDFELPNSPPLELPKSAEKENIIPRPDIYLLLVEDNELNQKLAQHILESFGMRYQVASNGQQALDLLEIENFDLILMDVQMPVMDGYETTKTIRHHFDPPKQHTPVIALTAHAMRWEKEKCLKAGMNDFISKPFDPNDLYQKIVALVKRPGSEETPKITKKKPPGHSPKPAKPDPQLAEKGRVNRGKKSEPVYESIELAYFDQLTDSKISFQIEMIKLFLERTPAALAGMRQALDANDPEALFQVTHGIKPSLLMFRVKNADTLLKNILHAIKTTEGSENLKIWVNQLLSTSEKALDELAVELSLLQKTE